MSEKMSILSSLTTLTIDIQKALQSWTNFQHHLSITAPAIVEVYVQRRPTIRLHSPQQEQVSMVRQEFVFVPPCFFRTKKRFVRGGDVEGASRHKSTWMKTGLASWLSRWADLVDQPTKSVGRLTRKICRLTKQSCQFTEPTGSYFL